MEDRVLMGRIIIKADKAADLYMEWSSVVEAPTWVGTRDEALKDGFEEVRLARADEKGSSCLDMDEGFWEDTGTIYKQQGWLPRENFLPFAQRFLESEPFTPDVSDLLKPFDDDILPED